MRQIERRIHQADVCECLGEITELAFCHWIILLGEKTDIIPDLQQPFKQSHPVRMPPLQFVIVRQPE